VPWGGEKGDAALFGRLPEGITRDQLQADYGGIGGTETRRLLGEIDRRIAALPLYR
jgi:hypothetical protein